MFLFSYCQCFTLASSHLQCPRIVALLAESYNPHVRYGAAMAVGLACSASGLPAAMRLLEPLMKDAVDFVRQGALIASALVLMQQPESKVCSRDLDGPVAQSSVASFS